MNLLDNLQSMLGGGKKREEYDDFVKRYDDGRPHEGYSDDEVIDRYGQVSRSMSPEMYEQSAEETFARMSPEERREFASYMRTRARERNVDFDGDDDDSRYEDPRELARATSRMQQRQPGFMEQLFGGGGGGGRGKGGSNMLDNPLAKAAMAGIAAMAVRKVLRGR